MVSTKWSKRPDEEESETEDDAPWEEDRTGKRHYEEYMVHNVYSRPPGLDFTPVRCLLPRCGLVICKLFLGKQTDTVPLLSLSLRRRSCVRRY